MKQGRPRREYEPGEVLDNGFVFIRETQPTVYPDGNKRRKAIFKCPACGEEKEMGITLAKRSKACGCLRGNPIQHEKGDRIGPENIEYIRDADPAIYPSGYGKRRAEFVCPRCGDHFVSLIIDVKEGHTRSCGCLYKPHGMALSSIYMRWKGIRGRCYNKNHHNYSAYGGRGIKMCEEWSNNAGDFIKYVMALPHAMEKGYSIDRIDNDGNYEPGNVRWATPHIQATNRRVSKSNTSGYVGVSLHNGSWTAYIRVKGENVWIGTFETREAAAGARNNYIIEHGLWEYSIQAIPDYLIY